MQQDIHHIFRLEFKKLLSLFLHTTELRERRSGKDVALCFILNAKSGNCAQNCGFCSQSAVSTANIPRYPLMSAQQITEAAEAAYQNGAYHFCIVTAGRGVKDKSEKQTILTAIEAIRTCLPVKICASLGIVDTSFLKELRDVGLHHFHHNLETSPAFFPQVCTSHTFHRRVQTVEAAKTAGLKVCSGGIFGLGESVQDRLELASWLQRLEVDSIPLNFLSPIKGTPMEGRTTLKPIECLQIITAYRLLFPDKPLVVCGGRGKGLRSLGPFMFAAGADVLLTGNYLTTKGRAPKQDAEMLADMGLRPKKLRM